MHFLSLWLICWYIRVEMFFHNKIYLIVQKALNLSIDLIPGHDSGHYKSLKSCNIYNGVKECCVNFMYLPLLMRLVDLYVRQRRWPLPCEMSLNYCNWRTRPSSWSRGTICPTQSEGRELSWMWLDCQKRV